MVGNEQARRHLRDQLVASIGEEAAQTLMDEMGSLGRDQLASRVDVQEGFAAVNERFAQIDQQFEQVNKRFEQVDQRFEQVDKRFEQVDKRFEQVDKRFEQVDKRFEQVDQRFEQVDQRFDGVDRELVGLRGDMNLGFAQLRTEIATQASTFSLDMAKQTRQLGIWTLASQTTLAAMIIGAIRL